MPTRWARANCWRWICNAYFAERGAAPLCDSGKPVIGICNGFQALVKVGHSAGRGEWLCTQAAATLTFNASGHFECRWVHAQARSRSTACGRAAWTNRSTARWRTARATLSWPTPASCPGLRLRRPDCPGVCPPGWRTRRRGRIRTTPTAPCWISPACATRRAMCSGLMPHPEDHIFPYQHPRWTRGEAGWLGLPLVRQWCAVR